MTSSNRHWPSMFKSKSSKNQYHQWQHEINPSIASHKSPYSSSVYGIEEKNPEPKPRWNPKPEQIRLLEAIFNSGMINPPRDEIRKIRAQLQEFGQIGDANVFYWFQNRKSRTKHKLRHLKQQQQQQQQVSLLSSKKSTPKGTNKSLPTTTCDQFMAEPIYSQIQQHEPLPTNVTQGFVPILDGHVLNDQINIGEYVSRDEADHEKVIKLDNYSSVMMNMTTPPPIVHNNATPTNTTVTVPISTNVQIQGPEESDEYRSRSVLVFINDLVFEVSSGPFNVREAFGQDAVLIHSSGQPVLTNECGVTLHPLQHSCFYYLI